MTSGKVVCGFCHKGGEESSTSGRLYSHESIHAHLRCMQYSSGLAQYQKGRYPQLGGFKWSQVKDEMKRGSHLKCHVCGKRKGSMRGATAGCTIRKCPKTFHFTCAALDKAAITKRIVVHSAGEDEKVFYRVFCGKTHFQSYEKQELKKLGAFEYQSDSEDDDDDDDDDESGTSDPQSSNSKDTVSEDRLSSTTTESSSERKHGYCDDSNFSSSEISASSPKKPKTDNQSAAASGIDENSLDSSSKDNLSSSNSHSAKTEKPLSNPLSKGAFGADTCDAKVNDNPCDPKACKAKPCEAKPCEVKPCEADSGASDTNNTQDIPDDISDDKSTKDIVKNSVSEVLSEVHSERTCASDSSAKSGISTDKVMKDCPPGSGGLGSGGLGGGGLAGLVEEQSSSSVGRTDEGSGVVAGSESTSDDPLSHDNTIVSSDVQA